MNYYAIYLRKSRADMEAEARGEGETLERHRTALRALAERRGFHVLKEYAELVSGDSIAARPQMQLLLDDVKRGAYAGVIVNDVDRLGRGDSIDQEIIKYTFIEGQCIIITPTRDIDPAAPSDEDMLDFNMFFARFEYRKITQRLALGRTRSAMAGNYISARVPYGYRKVINGKAITLEPDPETADTVRMVFDWYANGEAGYHAIANRLNDMGLKTYRGYDFSSATIKSMLHNPVYAGQIVWGRTATASTIEDGRRIKRHIKGQPIIAENAHPALIAKDVFDMVQERSKKASRISPKNTNKCLQNPVAGLVFCSVCGRSLEMISKRKRMLRCPTHTCPTVGIGAYKIVDILLETMRDWCAEYKTPVKKPKEKKESSASISAKKRLATLEGQLKRAQELVEMGVYAPSEYMQRKDEIMRGIDAARAQIDEATVELPTEDAIRLIIPTVEKVLDAYPYAETPDEQNALLRSVVSKVIYTKTQPGTKRIDPTTLVTLDVYPKLGSSL